MFFRGPGSALRLAAHAACVLIPLLSACGGGGGGDAGGSASQQGPSQPGNPPPPPTFPYAAPTNLTAVTRTPTEIDLSWTDQPTTETGFRITRSVNGSNDWTWVNDVTPDVTTYVDGRLTKDQLFSYRVQAINTTTVQFSDFSNVASAITYASVPAVPRNLSLSTTGPGIALSWMRLSNNDDGTAIERSSDGSTYAEIGRTAAGATAFTDSGASASGSLYYRVRAFNVLGFSPYSNVASNVSAPTSGPDLRISIQAQTVSAGATQTTFFTVNYANVGNQTAPNAQVLATVPTDTLFDVAASSPQWQCLDPGADMFALTANIGDAIRALKTNFPNLQQVFVSSHHYNGYTTTNGVIEPFAFQGGLAVQRVVQAQIEQMRSGTIDPLVGDLNYNSGIAPWVTWGPYLWADGLNPNGQGLFYEIADFNTDLVHPSPSGGAKIGNYLLNYFLSAPYTQWFRLADATPIPINPVPRPFPGQLALIDMAPSEYYFGLQGGLYPQVSNTLPADHLAAGMAAAARIQPLDNTDNPGRGKKILFLGVGYSNTLIIMNGFIADAAADPRVKPQSLGSLDTTNVLHILNGATGGGAATTWADPNHDVYTGNFGVRQLVTGFGYSLSQVQAVWFQAADSGLNSISLNPGLSGTTPGIACKLPLGDVASGASGSTTYALDTRFTFGRPITFTANALDDGSAGADLVPQDNTAQLTVTVTP